VARYAERIGRETGGNLAVILPAAYLHDIGIPEAERKHGSSAAEYQEMEGPPVARSILIRLGAPPELIDEVCDIVGHHHHPRPQETLNFAAVYDADTIVNLEERHKDNSIGPEKLGRIVSEAFLSESGRSLAGEVLHRITEAEGKEKA
jgi:HD superfamily phosphodiesterase